MGRGPDRCVRARGGTGVSRAHVILVSGWAHPAGTLARLAACLASKSSSDSVSLADLLADARSRGRDAPAAGGQAAVVRACRKEPAMSPYASALAQRIRAAVGQVCLVGWSTGGMVALEAADALPGKVKAVALLSATPRFCADEDSPWSVPEASLRVMRLSMRRNPESVLTDFFTRAALPRAIPSDELGPKVATALAMGSDVLCHGLDYLRDTDLRPAAGRVAQPCLVVHGKEDRVVPCRAGEFLARTLSRCSYSLLPDAGHALPEYCCETVAQRVDEFLETVP